MGLPGKIINPEDNTVALHSLDHKGKKVTHDKVDPFIKTGVSVLGSSSFEEGVDDLWTNKDEEKLKGSGLSDIQSKALKMLTQHSGDRSILNNLGKARKR
jgi:hypothetical protein